MRRTSFNFEIQTMSDPFNSSVFKIPFRCLSHSSTILTIYTRPLALIFFVLHAQKRSYAVKPTSSGIIRRTGIDGETIIEGEFSPQINGWEDANGVWTRWILRRSREEYPKTICRQVCKIKIFTNTHACTCLISIKFSFSAASVCFPRKWCTITENLKVE